MSLFIKPINEINIDDINTFCNQGLEEGTRLEYKKDFSGKNTNKQIAKAIASFANTYGGLLLIGIDTKDRKPKIPICGIEYKEGLEEKITSIAFKGINPPVLPEKKICTFQKNSKKRAIIGVFEEAMKLLTELSKIQKFISEWQVRVNLL